MHTGDRTGENDFPWVQPVNGSKVSTTNGSLNGLGVIHRRHEHQRARKQSEHLNKRIWRWTHCKTRREREDKKKEGERAYKPGGRGKGDAVLSNFSKCLPDNFLIGRIWKEKNPNRENGRSSDLRILRPIYTYSSPSICNYYLTFNEYWGVIK